MHTVHIMCISMNLSIYPSIHPSIHPCMHACMHALHRHMFMYVFRDISILWFLWKRETPHKKRQIPESVQQPSPPPRRNTEVLSAMNAFPENLVTLMRCPMSDELWGIFAQISLHTARRTIETHAGWRNFFFFFLYWYGLNFCKGSV